MKKIVIAGGSGYIGQAFYKKYKDKYHIRILSRNKSQENFFITSLEECDVLINLAGQSIFPTRWTNHNKQKILDSRVKYSKGLLKAASSKKINHYIQASAITYYPFSSSRKFIESMGKQKGANFSLKLVQDWESVVNKSNIKNNTILRLGVVMGQKSKFLEPIKSLFNLYLGGMVGDGKQWVSWIHIDDVTSVIDYIIQNKIYGPVNLTSPNPITNANMSSTIAQTLGKPNYLHVPKFLYRLMFGESSELLTEGHQVFPKLLTDVGYRFKYRYFKDALDDSI